MDGGWLCQLKTNVAFAQGPKITSAQSIVSLLVIVSGDSEILILYTVIITFTDRYVFSGMWNVCLLQWARKDGSRPQISIEDTVMSEATVR